MVTKDMLEWSRAQREDLKTEMHLTPGGTVEAEVNEWQRNSLETSIQLQEDILARARNAMRADRTIAIRQGLTRVQFNSPQEEIKP